MGEIQYFYLKKRVGFICRKMTTFSIRCQRITPDMMAGEQKEGFPGKISIMRRSKVDMQDNFCDTCDWTK